MSLKRKRDEDGMEALAGRPKSIGEQTSMIGNKMVRSQRYAKLRHEKSKAKKSERMKKRKEDEKAEKLGLEPAPKQTPKVTCMHVMHLLLVVLQMEPVQVLAHMPPSTTTTW
jgi:hypothetical protein